MLVIPAIDLKDGQCVRLRQGVMEDSTVFSNDPVATAERWAQAAARRLHLVDLNGAFAGTPKNGDAVKAITAALPNLPVQIGGGIRDCQTIEHYLNAGVSYVIVGIDAKAGYVATDGWAQTSAVRAVDLARDFRDVGVDAIVYTDIERDGMMQGVNISATVDLAQNGGLPVIASGGVTSIDDIQALADVAHQGITGAITGRAIYEGTLDITKAQALADTVSLA